MGHYTLYIEWKATGQAIRKAEKSGQDWSRRAVDEQVRKLARGARLKWEGDGCGMGNCDISYQTKSCATAMRIQRAMAARIHKAGLTPRAKRARSKVYESSEWGGMQLVTRCPRSR